jgi:hypothetical protein
MTDWTGTYWETLNVTNQAAWSSSNLRVATVAPAGVVTVDCTVVGEATIAAEYKDGRGGVTFIVR